MKRILKTGLFAVFAGILFAFLAFVLFIDYFLFIWILSSEVFAFFAGVVFFLIFFGVQLFLYWKCRAFWLKTLCLASAIFVTPWLAMGGIYLLSWIFGIPIIVQ